MQFALEVAVLECFFLKHNLGTWGLSQEDLDFLYLVLQGAKKNIILCF